MQAQCHRCRECQVIDPSRAVANSMIYKHFQGIQRFARITRHLYQPTETQMPAYATFSIPLKWISKKPIVIFNSFDNEYNIHNAPSRLEPEFRPLILPILYRIMVGEVCTIYSEAAKVVRSRDKSLSPRKG